MNTTDFFANIHINHHRGGGGYELRLINNIVGRHIDFFGGLNKKSLRKALETRNQYYSDFQYLPHGFRIKPVRKCVPDEKSPAGYHGIGLIFHPGRANSGLVITSRVKNLKTRRVTHMDFLLTGRSIKHSPALKQAIALKNKNNEQYEKITAEYNRLQFEKYFPLAKLEAKILKPRLNDFYCIDETTWKNALNRVFPKGLEKIYLAIE